MTDSFRRSTEPAVGLRRLVRGLVLVIAGGVLLGCATDPATPGTSRETVSASSPERTPTPTASRTKGFQSAITKVDRAQVEHSWRKGCPVGLKKLRHIRMTYRGFDKKDHTGEMIVHVSVAKDIVRVFKELYDKRYPIRRMELVDVYKGSDFKSIDADNSSAFNCRPATGSSSWSQHAYGLAVDVNPMENPYVKPDGGTAHRNARKFVDRPKLPGVIHNGDAVVKAFKKIGWGWGGTWSGTKDYQHFSSTGR